MNKTMNSFRIMKPREGCIVNDLSYSVNSANLLVIAGN
jgi:hypothetical protein